MNYKQIGALVALLIAGGSAMAASEMDQRWAELTAQATESGDLSSASLLDSFFGISPADFPNDNEEMTKMFLYEGLSDEGWQVISEARNTEADQTLEDLNFQGGLREAECELEHNDAYVIANAMADMEEAVLKRKLARYTAVLDSLSEGDQEIVRQHNLENYRRELPKIPQDQRNILLSLATEFPDVYLERYSKECKAAIVNRGRPFRRVVEGPGPGCGQTHTRTDNGWTFISSTGCLTWISYTQEPEESEAESPPD